MLSDGSFTTAGVGDGMYICHVNDRHHAQFRVKFLVGR